MTNKTDLKDSELLFFTDNYVLVTKNNKEVKSINELKGVTIGALETDLSKIKSTFEDNNQIIYNSYSNISSIVTALNHNDILYAIIPRTLYIAAYPNIAHITKILFNFIPTNL